MKVPFCFYPLNVKWNHGIALLSQLCRQQGVDTELCMLGDRAEFARKLATWPDRFVCFSAVTEADYRESLPFMEQAHEAGKRVLLGGVWAGLNRDVPDFVEGICRGEGERLPEFFLSGDMQVFRERQFWGDLNALPLPDYEMFQGIPFRRGLPETDGKFCLPYISSRGCPYQCSFCQAQLQAKFRVRTKIEEDLGELVNRYHPDLFFIGDANLPYMVPKWRASWGNFRYPFASYIRADIKPEWLEWLIDRGMIGCAFGVESGDETYRNQVLHKSLSDSELWRTVETLRKHKLWYVPFFMTDTPGETFRHKTKTAQMVRTIGGYPITWQYDELRSN